ncbi:hypothetical protein NCC78_00720 [Micromonospora phytophila]|uniref:hypothetical protein n=1 Tax=Micromonospora phytophila TaxID=709888 RepID=UPI00202EDE2A|nr:hypothetical protein [Micromonospora phytophila]MCM0673259.1 hypothetical protein [Micromonospora phytophila]
MSWLRRHRYSVPGVSPNSSHHGWDEYNGSRLADRPAVAAALDRAPRQFADLVFSPGDPDMALSREEFLAGITVGTDDGLSWTVSLAEEMKAVVDTGPDVADDDILLAALAERPEVSEAQHPDREVLEVILASPLRADEVLALAVDALSAAHRRLAQRLRIELPG